MTTEESDRYLQAVSAASPKVVDGVLDRSWHGRRLRYAVVGKERWVQTGGTQQILRDAMLAAMPSDCQAFPSRSDG